MRSKGIDQEMKATKPASLREKTVPELEQMLEQERAALYKARRDLEPRILLNHFSAPKLLLDLFDDLSDAPALLLA